MLRRSMLVMITCALLGSVELARAQQPASPARIAFLGPTTPLLEVFRKALTAIGYQDGRDVII